MNKYVETIGYFWVGELIEDGPFSIKLTRTAKVFETGRFNEFMRTGRTDNMEIEVLPPDLVVTLRPIAIIDWPHELFTEST